MIRERFDIAIVGASFAGLSCAAAAARSGCDVCVLDAKSSAGARPHTTGILVREAADVVEVPDKLVRKIAGVRLYAPDLNYIDLDAPGYHFLATDLPALLDWYANRAERAGAQLRFARRFTGAVQADTHVDLYQERVRASYLVGADGARSAVAGCFGLGRNRRFLIGIEHAYAGIEGVDPDRLHVFIDGQLAPGYIAWVVPGVNHTQVGLAGTHPGKLDIDGFVNKIRTLFDLSHASHLGRRGGLIPVGGRVHPTSKGRVLLLGDAAGTVSPLTAGGIHKALEIGDAAGRALGDATGRTLGDAGTSTRDPIREIERMLPRYAWKGLLRRAAGITPPDALVNTMLGSNVVRAIAQLIFFHHRGLFSRDAWHDLRRLKVNQKHSGQ